MDPTPALPVHVGLLATAFGPAPGGVGRYVRTLLLGLRELDDPALRLWVAARASARPALAPLLDPRRDRLGGPGRLGSLGALRPVWEQLALPSAAARAGVELLHGLMGAVPLASRACRVVTIHDATFVSHPGLHEPRKAAYFRFLLARSARAARLVVTDSQASAAELVAHLGLAPERIRVVPLAVDPALVPPGEAERARLAARFALERPYLLFAGVLEPRKNLPRLVAAWQRLRARGFPHRLLLAGKLGWRTAPIRAALAAAGEGVEALGYVSDDELRVLMAGAAAFVYVPLIEGFGLPVAEAMALGAPVVTSDRSSLPEVAGGAALLADPEDVDSIAAALARILEDPALAGELRARGARRAAELSPRRLAEGTRRVWAEALALGGPPPRAAC